jgi:predicted TIM-barrel fold metal-dependent hydrolase
MIIDVHTHLFGKGWIPKQFFYGVARFMTYEFAKQGIEESNEAVGDTIIDSSNDPEGESLLAEMEESGIDISVLLPVDFGVALGDPEVPIEEVNRHYAGLAKKHPDKLIAFAGVDPRRKNALDLFKQCVEEWGMRGLKLHPCAGFYPNQKEVYTLLEKATDWKTPVLIHSGSMMVPLKSKYSQSIHFDDLGADFPDLPIIAAHSGGSMGYMQMISIMTVKLNIMADISAWQVAADRNYPAFCKGLRDMMDFVEPGRILFGSDSPSFRSIMSNPDWVQLLKDLPEKAAEGISFKEEEITALLGGNAKKLFNL